MQNGQLAIQSVRRRARALFRMVAVYDQIPTRYFMWTASHLHTGGRYFDTYKFLNNTEVWRSWRSIR